MVNNPPISTKQTITSHLKSLNINNTMTQIYFYSQRSHNITKINENMNMDRTITGQVNTCS
jgi:hypothetical protein